MFDITYFNGDGDEFAACIIRLYIAQIEYKDNKHKREVESDSYTLTKNKAVNVIRCMHIVYLVEICQLNTEPCKRTSYSLLAVRSTAQYGY